MLTSSTVFFLLGSTLFFVLIFALANIWMVLVYEKRIKPYLIANNVEIGEYFFYLIRNCFSYRSLCLERKVSLKWFYLALIPLVMSIFGFYLFFVILLLVVSNGGV